MNKSSKQLVLVTGFAIFTMLFGAGNFMLPPKLGIIAGDRTWLAVSSFIITAVFLPILGLICSFLFQGDYKAFFYRMGEIPGAMTIGLCMLIIGPGLVMPRIVNLCYTMLEPFVPNLSLLVFSILFSILTFALAYKPGRFIDILGYLITPIKLLFVGGLIILGLMSGSPAVTTSISSGKLILESLLYGYNTLDLLGTVFFGSVILESFEKNQIGQKLSMKTLIKDGIIASCIGALILSIVYFGMSLLGTFHGEGLFMSDEAQTLSAISIRIVGSKGGFIGACALMVACLATMIALSTVVAEYIQKQILRGTVNFPISLILMLIVNIIVAQLGLTSLMEFSAMLTQILYPVLVTLTLCNMAYKIFGFKPVKIPVYSVLLISIFVTVGVYEYCKDCLYKQDPILKTPSL